MPPLRVTSANALSTVRQLAADLARSVHEAGPLAAAPGLPRQLERLAADLPLMIEVWLDDETSEAQAREWLLGEEGGPAGVMLAFGASDRPVSTPTGQVAPAVLVWLSSAPPGVEPPLDRYALVISTKSDGLRGTSAAQDCMLVDRGGGPGVLTRLLTVPPLASSLDLLKSDGAARALETLAAVAGLAFEQELRTIRAKRTLSQQRGGGAQAKPPTVVNEVVGAIRLKLQRSFGELARGVEERFQTEFGSMSAPFWADVDRRLEAIDALDTEARVRTLATKLQAEAETAWLQLLRDRLWQHGVADLAALRDTLRAAGHDIEKTVGEADGPPVVIRFQQLSDERLTRLLDQHLLFQRKYQGEMVQHGPLEYISMARRYQTIVYMFLSAFGLSFLRSYREFMIPAAIALLSLGGLQVVNSVRRERVEKFARELEKLRDVLRSELRRMVSDMQRAWPAAVAQHLTDQVPYGIGSVETSIRDHYSRLAAEGAEERQRLQRQLQMYEVAERKLAAPAKARDGIAQNIAQLRGELRQLIVSTTRPQTR